MEIELTQRNLIQIVGNNLQDAPPTPPLLQAVKYLLYGALFSIIAAVAIVLLISEDNIPGWISAGTAIIMSAASLGGVIWACVKVERKYLIFEIKGGGDCILMNTVLATLERDWKAEYSIRIFKADQNSGQLILRTLYTAPSDVDRVLASLADKNISAKCIKG